MGYEITENEELITAIENGYPILITHSDTQKPLDVHEQIFVPNKEGSHSVYEGLFWPRVHKTPQSMTIIDTAPHKDEFDNIKYGTQDFILRKNSFNNDFFNKHYLDKYKHEVNDSKYKVIAFPELTYEMIDQSAMTERFHGETYPEYSCHTFVNNTIQKSIEISKERQPKETPKPFSGAKKSATSTSCCVIC
ncbi:MAG: hypothetical protein EP298_10040 [Gammaproteobacteria bacterium]|nr:MAG: hypothetical protein EP298_10040 [Gammaproteobacteria bacterium]UTW41578.1 hypothetical protein KFE69_08665 [bacterium SCSIO 12844]